MAGIVWRNPLHLAVEMLREKKKGKLEVQYHLQEHSPVDPKTSAWLLALIEYPSCPESSKLGIKTLIHGCVNQNSWKEAVSQTDGLIGTLLIHSGGNVTGPEPNSLSLDVFSSLNSHSLSTSTQE